MYQNELIKSQAAILAKSIPDVHLNNVINFIAELEKEAEEALTVIAKKSVVEENYRTDALLKYGIHLGYKDLLDRFKKIRDTYK